MFPFSFPASADGGGGGIVDMLVKALEINPAVVLVQAVIFIVTIFILWRFLFGPLTKFTRKRNEQMEEAVGQIREKQADVEKLTADYEEKIAVIEKEAYEHLQQAIREAKEARARIVSEAEAEARNQIETAHAEIAKEREAARAAIREEVKRLAVEAAERLTGRPLDEADKAEVERILSEEAP